MGDDDDDMDMDLGDDDMDLGADDADTGDAGGDEEETLLAVPPARRSDRPSIGEKYTTARAKGKVYKKRGEGKKKSVARKYHMRSDAGDSYGKNTTTNTVPGLKDLSTLANGIFESEDTTYKNDENKILQANQDQKLSISQRLRNLEKTRNES